MRLVLQIRGRTKRTPSASHLKKKYVPSGLPLRVSEKVPVKELSWIS